MEDGAAAGALFSILHPLSSILVFASLVVHASAATTQPTTNDDMGAPPPQGAVVLFDGSSLDAWQAFTPGKPMKSFIDDGKAMVVAGGNLLTKQEFGDVRMHVEFRCPDMPKEITGQDRGNSGIYFQNRYELQILGYHGPTLPTDMECGGLHGIKPPDALATRPDGQWQVYDIVFRSPRFDASGKKTEPARLTVTHNGVRIHTDVAIDKPTGGGRGEEAPTGPIRLQDRAHKVAFRNVWVVPVKE